MNKISLSINAILIIAVGVLFYFHFSGKKGEVATDAALLANRDSISHNLTMVYVNVDTLFEKYNYVAEVNKDLDAKKNTMQAQISSKISQLENKLGAKNDAFQKKVQEFESKAEGMNQTIQQIKMQALQEEDQQLQQEQQEAQQQIMQLKEDLGNELMKLEAEHTTAIQKTINAYLEKYNKDHNYTFILSHGTGGGVLLANPALDVTSEVLSGLNKEYDELKKTEEK